MKWELEHFNAGLDQGLPKDEREVDRYLERMSKHNTCLLQWLEEFKGKFVEFEKFAEFEQARTDIRDSETALQKYRDRIGPIMMKVNIAKALDARAKDGSPLVLLFRTFYC